MFDETFEIPQALDKLGVDLLPESDLRQPGDLIEIEIVNAPTRRRRILSCLVVASAYIPARAAWRGHSAHIYLAMHKDGGGTEYLLHERFVIDTTDMLEIRTTNVGYFDIVRASRAFGKQVVGWKEE